MSDRRGDDFDVRLLDGRGESFRYRVGAGDAGARLDCFLAGRLTWRSRSSVRKLLDAGLVTLAPDPRSGAAAGGRSARASRRVQAGEVVSVRLPRPLRDEALACRRRPEFELPRLFEDDLLIAIDKPPDMAVHPSGALLHHTVITALHRAYRDFDDPSRDVVPKLCHRLDLETSGVLLVAKTRPALVHVQAQFERRTVGKEYLVLVHGAMAADSGLIDLPIGPASVACQLRNAVAVRHDVGLPSRTRWRALRRWDGHTLCHVELLTGRHHQIRVHMAAIGHPVVGDKIYGRDESLFLRYRARELTERDRAALELPRQALHSHALAFDHPTRGRMRIESPLPPDLAGFCERLEPAAAGT